MDKYGSHGPEVAKLAKALDAEAERVTGLIAISEPAYKHGEPVQMSYTIPLNIVTKEEMGK